MSKQEALQKSFRFSEDTIQKIDLICTEEHITQSFLFAKLTDEYYEKIVGNDGSGIQPDKNFGYESVLKKLKIIENDTNKKVTILLDVLNSFVSNGIIAEADNFSSAEDQPHVWVEKAKELISLKITESQYKNNV